VAEYVGFAIGLDEWSVGFDGFVWIGDGLFYVVFDLDEYGGASGGAWIFGGDDSEDIAGVIRALTDGDEDWPVFFDESDESIAGYIVGGDDAMDTGECERFGGVDSADCCSWVVGQSERGVEHVWGNEVIDERSLAERCFDALIAWEVGADAGCCCE